MYAVIQTGGKQYRVEKGETLTIEKLPVKAGDDYRFEEVLLVCENGKVQIGTPTVPKAVVTAKVVREAKEKKIVVFKFKRRKNYRRTQGHRQQVSIVKIEDIQIG